MADKILNSLMETEEFARECLDLLKKQANKNQATTVALEGDLGAGKTTFTQAVARTLGIRARVTSPTFVIMKKYSVSVGAWKNLIHIDCYRLDRAEDLLHLGWNEIATDPANLILVEWPERVGKLLSSLDLKINFEVIGETSRKIIYGER